MFSETLYQWHKCFSGSLWWHSQYWIAKQPCWWLPFFWVKQHLNWLLGFVPIEHFLHDTWTSWKGFYYCPNWACHSSNLQFSWCGWQHALSWEETCCKFGAYLTEQWLPQQIQWHIVWNLINTWNKRCLPKVWHYLAVIHRQHTVVWISHLKLVSLSESSSPLPPQCCLQKRLCDPR